MRLGGLGIATVNIRGWDGSAWQNLPVQDATTPNLRVAIYDGTSRAAVLAGSSDNRPATYVGLLTQSFVYGFDGTDWDRLRSDPNMHLNVNIGGLANLAHGQVTVSDAATVIKAANSSRKTLTIKNIGANTVYLGGSGVTTSNGFKLTADEGLSDIRSTTGIYGVCASGESTTVCYWEE